MITRFCFKIHYKKEHKNYYYCRQLKFPLYLLFAQIKLDLVTMNRVGKWKMKRYRSLKPTGMTQILLEFLLSHQTLKNKTLKNCVSNSNLLVKKTPSANMGSKDRSVYFGALNASDEMSKCLFSPRVILTLNFHLARCVNKYLSLNY